MADHNTLGKKGESLAEAFLIKQNFTILCKNYQYSHYEIDIIAKKEQFLHFIEVKTRKSFGFSFPEESIDKKKKKNLKMAASNYIYKNHWLGPVQFDLVLVFLIEDDLEKITFIEDVIN